MGLNLALKTKPQATRVVILEVGCGMGDYTFDGVDDKDAATGNVHPISTLFSLLNIAMTGGEEWSNHYLRFLNKRLIETVNLPLPTQKIFHYKFQPEYSDSFSAELDNSNEAWRTSLEQEIDAHYSAESSQIANILGHLTV
jgi:hypothetical protein